MVRHVGATLSQASNHPSSRPVRSASRLLPDPRERARLATRCQPGRPIVEPGKIACRPEHDGQPPPHILLPALVLLAASLRPGAVVSSGGRRLRGCHVARMKSPSCPAHRSLMAASHDPRRSHH